MRFLFYVAARRDDAAAARGYQRAHARARYMLMRMPAIRACAQLCARRCGMLPCHDAMRALRGAYAASARQRFMPLIFMMPPPLPPRHCRRHALPRRATIYFSISRRRRYAAIRATFAADADAARH